MIGKMKVYLSSLGCKLNESELEGWARQFAADGYEVVDDAHKADVCVVNSCTVTQAAARKSRGMVNRFARANKNAKIVLTGCYATISSDEAHGLPNVSLVVPNSDKDNLVSIAGRLRDDPNFRISENGCRMPRAASGELVSDQAFASSRSVRAGAHFLAAHAAERYAYLTSNPDDGQKPVYHPRTRAFVKIEDGCNLSCTYCIIPTARGKARSRPQEEIVAEVAGLVEEGYQEVVLTGVQISDYRPEERAAVRGRLQGLCSLVQDILDKTQVRRLRLTSIAPWDMDDELLAFYSNPRVCRHLHLSLQSGSSQVLRRMRRPYTPDQFAATVERVRTRVPEVAITTDVIVAFPGESEAEFQESLDFVERMHFSRVHVFPYSRRAGTKAAQYPSQVSDHEKDSRAKAMQLIADDGAKRYASQFLGRTLPVLYETNEEAPGTWSGYTGNYVRVIARSDQSLANRILPTRLDQIGNGAAIGSIYLLPILS
jgi:threonylcarbamoyladenosine tRNA methylthiotransferase MtaB